MEKGCTKCRVVQPLSAFNKKKAAPDGVRSECRACQKSYFASFAANNEEYLREKDRKRYHADPKAEVSRNEKWRAASDYNAVRREKRLENAEAEKERERAWYAANREKQQAKNREAKKNNRPYHTRKQNERNARKLNATPAWADARYVQMFYEMAKEAEYLTGVKHHVDHIVPLQSNLVCGLNWEQNLQILPAAENIRKGNRVWPNMP